MSRKPSIPQRRTSALSREQIVDAAIALLDSTGEAGLTFRHLAERLATGPGAIYWHVANKSDLLTAASDRLVLRTLEATPRKATPETTLRALALALFDMIDAHPWIGAALANAPGQMPVVRILESIGQQVRALGVTTAAQWATACALLNYILGVGGQNAANGQLAQARGIERDVFLGEVAAEWSNLDPDTFPFARSMAPHLKRHDDRADFLTGVDLIVKGMLRA